MVLPLLLIPLIAGAASWQHLSITGQTPGNLGWSAACYVNSWGKLFNFGNGNGPTEDKYTCWKSENTGGLGYLNTEYTFDYASRAWTCIRPDHDVTNYQSFIETRKLNDSLPWPAEWRGEPPGRDNHQMVYDPVLDAVYLLGGTCSGGLWMYDLKTRVWYILSTKGLYTDLARLPAGDPDLRSANAVGEVFNCAMAFDYLKRRIVIYGGRLGGQCPVYDRTYTFDCTNPRATQRWVQIARNGVQYPPLMEQGECNAVYDPAGEKVIWFGGSTGTCGETPLAETWELDCKTDTWSKVSSPQAPSARTFPNFAYDPYHRRGILHGGSSGGTDTWAYDPAARTWAVIASGGPASNRFCIGGYDLKNRRYLHYTANSETWALTYEDGQEYPLIPYPEVPIDKQPKNMNYRGDFIVFPNPVIHSAQITATGQGLRIYDSQGRLAGGFGPAELKSGKVRWDASALPAGVYLIRLDNADETRRLKALVIH